MIKCQHLRLRHKKGELYYYCTKHRQIANKECFKECLDKEYKLPKQLSKKSKKQKTLEDSRYSIIQENLSKCFFCNNKAEDWHEMLKGRNRKKCIKWGLAIRICRICHEKTEKDNNFYRESRKVAQKKWKEYYNKNDEDFIKEFGNNYLL